MQRVVTIEFQDDTRRPPVQELMIRVLASACEDLDDYGDEGHECRICARSRAIDEKKDAAHVAHSKYYRRARRWVIQDHDTPYPFSFNNICDEIGVDPGRMRKRILAIDKSRKEQAA